MKREKLKLEVEKLFFLLQVHFPPLEYAKFTARKTRHEVDNGLFLYRITFFPVSPKTKKIGAGKKSDPLYRKTEQAAEQASPPTKLAGSDAKSHVRTRNSLECSS